MSTTHSEQSCFTDINMKHFLVLIFCISLLAGCSQRHESLADGHMINNGQPPENPISVNTLFPGELKNVGKVENNSNQDVWSVYEEFLDGSYYDFDDWNHRHKRYYRPRRYTPRRYY